MGIYMSGESSTGILRIYIYISSESFLTDTEELDELLLCKGKRAVPKYCDGANLSWTEDTLEIYT
jgi:hypothetical protein